MMWETVIGLEVHTELSAKSKIFCGCDTSFGAKPNTQVCPVCAGMPGSLPKLNIAVVERAIRLGLALNCEIRRSCKFDRKNYFYPDLPKAYQISQLYSPICMGGYMEIGGKRIGIREIHMEEDAGKLIHDSGFTYMDFNRCGVPLLEIVSQPDFRGSDEVIAYLEALREMLLYLDVSDCKMQEGSLRADINLSVRPIGGDLGVRTEMKNLSSFRAIGRAIEHEAARQTKILESGGKVIQETRRWDDIKGESYSMRSKENAHDYRYFPEPDLLPLEIDEQWLARIRRGIPELAHQKRDRYARDFGLAVSAAAALTAHRNIADLFEDLTRESAQPLEVANLITGEIMRLMNRTNTLSEDLRIDAKKLATLISLVINAKISRNSYKQAVGEVFMRDTDPREYITKHGLMMISDDNAAAEAVNAVLAENPEAVKDYKCGKDKAFGFLMGQAMKKLGGAADPKTVGNMLREVLGDC
ncbi:MAG: Asp-tRNA(Asn)/Glu-tRNA(Gln) amidotransferase subunit GatB [Oscillospiraceae bacterium]|nr:Asp-tRNA(Asn)/Glu-tRNA(Gln) amidotransferase subunit GatB [Oscillospiraceae bacterium]